MTYFRTAEEWLSAKPRHTKGIRILQICIGVMICFRIGTELPFATYFWGPNGIATYENSQYFFGTRLGRLLDLIFYSSDFGIYLLVALLFLSAIALIFNIKTRIAVFVCLISFILQESRLPALNDGGDNITRLTLFYMLFLMSHPLSDNLNKLKIWIHNVGVAAIIMQLMILYEVSGFMKASGEKWQNGTAMYVISRVEWFSLPGFRDMFLNPYITTIASYIPMFFMMLFPVAIFSRLKLVWIFIGILMHLGIAYSMGLVTFSTIMIGLELFLITDEEYARIKVIFQGSKIGKFLSPKLETIFGGQN